MASVLNHFRRLPFSLDPLIAEAKRRARQSRLLLVAVLVVLLVAATIGVVLGLPPATHPFVATRPLERAFVRQSEIDSWGVDSAPKLHFVPREGFAIGIVLTNEASEDVTLTDVTAVRPSTPLLRQLGTRLVAFNWPGHCPHTPSCPGLGVLDPRQHGTVRPQALRVLPGRAAGVQLNFQFVGCGSARHASSQNVNRIDVTYRIRVGAIVHQRVALGPLALSIGPPKLCSG